MEGLNFRTLKANEIDCRISTVKGNGISLLLYKDARVDQNILDEVIGPMNWQRRHTRDNANCIVSLWDTDKKQWIEKEDTGTESFTAKEKGLASDSFKRACFNWGIGRELYTAPFIWINTPNCTIKSLGKDKFTCYDEFYVSQIGYDENRNINSLVVRRQKDNKTVFNMGKKANIDKPAEKEPEAHTEMQKLSENQIEDILNELSRTGIGLKGLCRNYKVETLDLLTEQQYQDAMQALKSKPDRLSDSATIPPDNVGNGLPWGDKADKKE